MVASSIADKDKVKAWLQGELRITANAVRRRYLQNALNVWDKSMRTVRLHYWTVRQWSVQSPQEQMSFMIDGATQDPYYIPHFAGYSKKNNGFHWQLYCMITHARVLIMFYVPMHVKHDANLICTLIIRGLNIAQDLGELPPRLYAQVEGAADNWNKVVFALHALLAATGVFCLVELARNGVGWTHDDADGTFGAARDAVESGNFMTFSEFEGIFKERLDGDSGWRRNN